MYVMFISVLKERTICALTRDNVIVGRAMMVTIFPLCPWNSSHYSCCGMYMFYGGINYKLRGQRSCVQTHSCPTEKLQQTLELLNMAIRLSLQLTYPGPGPDGWPRVAWVQRTRTSLWREGLTFPIGKLMRWHGKLRSHTQTQEITAKKLIWEGTWKMVPKRQRMTTKRNKITTK